MNIAEKIYETVKNLPAQQAGEVLSFAESLRAKQEAEEKERRTAALATLAKYRGRFQAEKFNRDECYDRPGIR
jgi:spore coat polysaccharide biosynthesis protein SpsF (cytidylyltransferase family)